MGKLYGVGDVGLDKRTCNILRQENIRTRGLGAFLRQENIRTRGLGVFKDKRTRE